MDEDIMRAIEQAAAQAEQNQDRQYIGVYIEKFASQLTQNARAFLATSHVGIPEPAHSYLEQWHIANRNRLAQQIGQVARILLRKELLGE